jgi:hypothetical protein
MKMLKTRSLKSILPRLVAAAIGLVAVVGGGNVVSIRPVSAAGLTSISVVGNHFVDGNGAAIRLLGVNRSGSEYMCTGGGANVFDGPSDDTSIAAMASWHINAVRLGLNEDCWLGINGFPASMSASAYQAAIIDYVNRLHLQGMYAIVELHWNAPGTQQSTGQQVMVDADHGTAFWSSVANAFKSDTKVLFDLYNEPQGISWSCLRDGCMQGFQTVGMQSLVNTVRSIAPTQPILIGGIGYAGDASQWLTYRPTGSGIVASFHTYDFVGNCNSLSCASTLLPIAASVPLVTGELGETDCAHGYIDTYMPWADANGISYLGWAWDTNGCNSFPSLISNYDGTPTNFGIGFRDHLAALASSTTPTVTLVAPNSGPAAGGTSVTITGTNLTGATAVKFGTVAASSFTVNSAVQITATSPAGSGGVDVRVTTPAGTSAISAGDAFTFITAPPARMTAVSLQQYALANSDGLTWQDMDAANLSLSVTPTSNTQAIVSANADLWTANAGYNQDIGIWMNPTTAPGGIVGWKESGGSGGNYSPNAAQLQTVVSMTANVTYSFKLRWKTNRPASGATIHAGAGPLSGGGGISPTRLTVQLVPTANLATAVMNQQYSQSNSDGATWKAVDATNLVATLLPTGASTAVLSANVDLWTATAGYNQDIGIFVSVNGGADQLVAWKESGGAAGTYSPNAAFVQASYPMSAGTYTFRLKWKANQNAAGATIFAGAGSAGAYSPTRLTAQLVPTANVSPSSRTQQYSLANNDGTSWVEIDTNLRVAPLTGVTGAVLLGGNADLWTANAGYNQDIGIFVSVNGGADQLVAWKESGGFAGTFSPNAAYVQSVYNITASSTYVFKLKWKTNKSAAGATIYAGAGPIAGQYSPTSLVAQLIG